jgi:hypothetical protein
MIDLIEKTFHWLKQQLPGRVSRPGNDRLPCRSGNLATPVCRTPRAVVHCQTPEDVQSATQSKWNSSMPTNLKIVPRLLSFAAAAFVLLGVVNADAQPPATSSVVIPPISPGQARIWIYSGSQPTNPFNYPHMEAVTLNGVKVGYEQLGGVSTAMLRPGIALLPPPASWHLIPASLLQSTLLPDRRHT